MWLLAWLQAMLFMTAHATVATCDEGWVHWSEWTGPVGPRAMKADEEWYNTRAVICDSPKIDFICTWSGCVTR